MVELSLERCVNVALFLVVLVQGRLPAVPPQPTVLAHLAQDQKPHLDMSPSCGIDEDLKRTKREVCGKFCQNY